MRSNGSTGSPHSFLQSPHVLCLEASAGSGKTYCLAKRYVHLSLCLVKNQNCHPERSEGSHPNRDSSPFGLRMTAIQSILAITFTNKATWSMKSRILDLLKRICLKQLKSFEADDIL